jgi:hypothetical protein
MEDDVMKKIAVITGASSGMGKEFALQISEKYKTIEEIWLIARSTDKLNEVKRQIHGKTVRVLSLDLTRENDINFYKSLLERQNPMIRVLVNAAGYGVMGHFDEIPYEDSVGMIDLNCRALTAITAISLPYMSYPSNIINLASSAGFLPQPSFAVYAATKAMVLSYSRALNQELKDKGITVTAVCPGPVDTPFFDRAEKITKTKAFKNILRVKPDKVVKKALLDAYNFKDVSVYGTTIKAFRGVTKVVPDGMIINFIK